MALGSAVDSVVPKTTHLHAQSVYYSVHAPAAGRTTPVVYTELAVKTATVAYTALLEEQTGPTARYSRISLGYLPIYP
jgi:hypothetical protein